MSEVVGIVVDEVLVLREIGSGVEIPLHVDMLYFF